MTDAINPQVTDSETTENLKSVADEWLALAARIGDGMKVILSTSHKDLSASAPMYQEPGGVAEQWLAMEERHLAVVQLLPSPAQRPHALLRCIHPSFDPFVIAFMSRVLTIYRDAQRDMSET